MKRWRQMSSVPRFKSTLMNMVLRDLSGWRCEKLTEHSAVLHLNAFTGLSAMLSKTVIHGQYSQLWIQGERHNQLSFAGQNSRSSARMAETLSRHFTGSKSTAGLINYLNCFPNLQQALSELDYRRFTLVLHHKEWYCSIELWAASEVVCKCRRCAVICGLSGTSVFFCLVW